MCPAWQTDNRGHCTVKKLPKISEVYMNQSLLSLSVSIAASIEDGNICVWGKLKLISHVEVSQMMKRAYTSYVC